MHVCARAHIHMHVNMCTFVCAQFASVYVCPDIPVRTKGMHMCVHMCAHVNTIPTNPIPG